MQGNPEVDGNDEMCVGFATKDVVPISGPSFIAWPLREVRIMPERPDRILSDFGRTAMALAEMLQRQLDLGLLEQIFIENHIHVLQSAYSSWKRRNTQSEDRLHPSAE